MPDQIPMQTRVDRSEIVMNDQLSIVLKKNEEKGKSIASSVFWILGVIELILLFVAISNGGAEAGVGFAIFVFGI
mgnify:CR=1 FL=1